MSSGMGGPLPRVLAPATFLAARVYGAVVAARNTAFDAQRHIVGSRDASEIPVQTDCFKRQRHLRAAALRRALRRSSQ